eukprot:1632967-Amphidinium_carterae.1
MFQSVGNHMYRHSIDFPFGGFFCGVIWPNGVVLHIPLFRKAGDASITKTVTTMDLAENMQSTFSESQSSRAGLGTACAMRTFVAWLL